MVALTCKNHPDLRWLVKEIAWTVRPDGTGFYNGCRHIHFMGLRDGSYATECPCPPSDLEVAPEDKETQ